MSGPSVCANCRASLAGGTHAPLWDGRSYCLACINAASPALARYRGSHDTLEESRPRPRLRPLLKHLAVKWVAVTVLVPLPFALIVADDGLDAALAFSLPVCWVVGVLMLLVCLFELWVELDWSLRTMVRVQDGLVTVSNQGGRTLLKRPLLECCWWVREAGWNPRCVRAWMIVPRELPIVHLAMPHRFLGVNFCQSYVLCGFTEDMRRLWEDFLTLAKVPRRMPWSLLLPVP